MNSLYSHFFDTYGCVNLTWATRCAEHPLYNFGDELSFFINSKLFSDIKFRHVNFNTSVDKICSIGTILHNIKNGINYIWGTGIDRRFIPENFPNENLNIYSVRGKHSQNILKSQGFSFIDVVGEPALLINKFISKKENPSIKLGIIPHCDQCIIFDKELKGYKNKWYANIQLPAKIISTLTNINTEYVLNQLSDCEYILSQSIHGCVVADSLGIPNLFVQNLHNSSHEILSCLIDRENSLVEHRYLDYISAFDYQKNIVTHSSSVSFDIDKIVDLIEKYYIPVDTSVINDRLLSVHPLLID